MISTVPPVLSMLTFPPASIVNVVVPAQLILAIAFIVALGTLLGFYIKVIIPLN